MCYNMDMKQITVDFLKTEPTGQITVGVIVAKVDGDNLRVIASGNIAQRVMSDFTERNPEANANDVIEFLTKLPARYDSAYLRALVTTSENEEDDTQK